MYDVCIAAQVKLYGKQHTDLGVPFIRKEKEMSISHFSKLDPGVKISLVTLLETHKSKIELSSNERHSGIWRPEIIWHTFFSVYSDAENAGSRRVTIQTWVVQNQGHGVSSLLPILHPETLTHLSVLVSDSVNF